VAAGERDRQVLLDRDAPVQVGVVREIGDPEPAVTERPLDAIPVVDDVSRSELDRVQRVSPATTGGRRDTRCVARS